MEAPRILELRSDDEVVPQVLIVAFGDRQGKRRRVRDPTDEFASFGDRVPLRYRLLERGEDMAASQLNALLPTSQVSPEKTEDLQARLAVSAQRAVFDELVLSLNRFKLTGASVREVDGKIFEVLSLEAVSSRPAAQKETETPDVCQSGSRKRLLQRDVVVDQGRVHRYALDVDFHKDQGLTDALPLEEVKARLRDSFISQTDNRTATGFVDLGNVTYDEPVALELLSRRGVHKGFQDGIEADRQDANFYDKYKDVKADDESDGVADENASVDYPSSSNEGSFYREAERPLKDFLADSDDSVNSSLSSPMSSAELEPFDE